MKHKTSYKKYHNESATLKRQVMNYELLCVCVGGGGGSDGGGGFS